ncbi:unnamed protein product [Heterobilharzia americana]|nr:unnamed protein product [Heterobilharzia americana]
MSSTSDKQNLDLVAKLLGPSLYSGGDVVKCEIAICSSPENVSKQEYQWSFTGIVGCIVGQCKLDNRQLTTSYQVAPKSLSLSNCQWKYDNILSFDAESLITSALEPKSHLICVIPMHVKYTPNTRLVGPANLLAYLPYNLSPSIRGTLFKFAYKVVVAVQVKNVNSEIKEHLIQLRLRILPSSMMYHSLRIQECDIEEEDKAYDFSNPFLIPRAKDKKSYFDFAFDGGFSTYSQSGVSSSHSSEKTTTRTTSSAGQMYSTLSQSVPQYSRKEFIYATSRMELMNVLACSPPANFVVSTPRGSVGRLSFQRTLLCLGEMIRGYFDFSAADVACFMCEISLESEERYMLHDENPFLAPECEIKTRKDEVQNYSIACLPLTKLGQPFCTDFHPLGTTRYTTETDIKLCCMSKLMLPFTIPIPTNITPQFHSVSLSSPFISLDYRWRLHLEFDLISESSKMDVSDHLNGKSCIKKPYGTVWTFPNDVKTEKFTMNIPIQLVLSDPSVIDNLWNSVQNSVCISHP